MANPAPVRTLDRSAQPRVELSMQHHLYAVAHKHIRMPLRHSVVYGLVVRPHNLLGAAQPLAHENLVCAPWIGNLCVCVCEKGKPRPGRDLEINKYAESSRACVCEKGKQGQEIYVEMITVCKESSRAL